MMWTLSAKCQICWSPLHSSLLNYCNNDDGSAV